MAKEFFITLNTRELDALRDTDYRTIQGYLYIKRNSDFSEGKTKKICYGALSGYITKIDRTQAKRTVQKLIQLGLLKATDTEQIFELCFCGDTENDTITNNTSNTLKNNLLQSKTGKKIKEEENFFEGKEGKRTAEGQAPDKTPLNPQNSPFFEGEGVEVLRGFARAKKWQYADHQKSVEYYKQAQTQIERQNLIALEMLEAFQKSDDSKTPLGFQKFLTARNAKPKITGLNPNSLYRGDLVL